jgi:CspA family cold shock protein
VGQGSRSSKRTRVEQSIGRAADGAQDLGAYRSKVGSPASGDGVIMCDSDMNDYELAPNALEGSIFRMLRQGQRVVFQLNDAKQASQISLGSEVDMKTPGY